MTSRGFDEEDLNLVGRFIANSIHDFESTRKATEKAVAELCGKHPIYQ